MRNRLKFRKYWFFKKNKCFSLEYFCGDNRNVIFIILAIIWSPFWLVGLLLSISVSADGSERDVTFSFWLFGKWWTTFEGFFPEWVYPLEFNSYSCKQSEPNANCSESSRLKGRERTKEKGWIRSDKRQWSIKIHNWAIWWNFWTDDGFSGKPPVSFLRRGSTSSIGHKLKNKILGRQIFEETLLSEENRFLDMPEGRYNIIVKLSRQTNKRKRWFSKTWQRYTFIPGYYDDKNELVETPVIHWGKGESSWNCGMNGTYELSTSSKVKNEKDAFDKFVLHCLSNRECYGYIDTKNWTNTTEGFITENLISKFEK